MRPDTQSGMLPREDDEFLFNFSERQNISSNSQQLVVQLYTTASQTVYNNNWVDKISTRIIRIRNFVTINFIILFHLFYFFYGVQYLRLRCLLEYNGTESNYAWQQQMG